MIKKIALIAGAATAVTIAGCGSMNMTEPMIVRKVGNDTVWVKEIKNSTETVKAYKVQNDYYLSDESNPGQVFDSKYAVGNGLTEYTYSW